MITVMDAGIESDMKSYQSIDYSQVTTSNHRITIE